MKKTTSLVFTGDIGFDRYMDGKWEDDELISGEVLDFLHSGDHVIANVEGAMVDRETNKVNEGTAALLHTMNPKATKVLKNMHADIWNLCNNHIMDAGDEGVKSTLQIAEKNGAMTIGAGMNYEEAAKPIILDEAGGIGIFSVGYRRGCKPAGEDKAGCLLWNDLEQIQKNIDEIKSKCRWCIIVAHGGEEFTSLPSPYTRDRYLKFLDMGADIIVSHHPHVPMNYEIVTQKHDESNTTQSSTTQSSTTQSSTTDKIIFYSLGNFIFDTDYQRSQFNTEKGLLVKINLDENGYTWEPMGLKIVRENSKIKPETQPETQLETQPETQPETQAKMQAEIQTEIKPGKQPEIKPENNVREHIESAPLPAIFTNVGEEDYRLLAPLSAKAFVSATKRQQIYMNRAEYENASEEKWAEHFANPKRSGRVEGEGLDFFIICPLAAEAENGEWKKSGLEAVKKYIIDQIL